MADNYVSVRIYHHQTKDMAYVAQENFRARDPKYTKIDSPRVIAEMNGRRLEIAKAYTEKGRGNARSSVRDFIYKSQQSQIERFQAAHRTKSGKGRKWQSNQNTFSHVIISFSSSGLDGISGDELLRLGKIWAEKWAAENHIKNLYICLHLDEKTPHLHLCFENITAEGISFRRRVLKSTLSHCQDLAGEVFGEIGFKRGVSRELTGAEHEYTKEYNRRVLIEQEKAIAAGKDTIADQEVQIESNAVIAKSQKENIEANSVMLSEQQEREKELIAEITRMKEEISALRRTKEEQAAADREEERKRKVEISNLRKQKKMLMEELSMLGKREEQKQKVITEQDAMIKKQKEVIESDNRRVEAIERTRRHKIAYVEYVLKSLLRVCPVAVGFAYRTKIKAGTKNNSDWYLKRNPESNSETPYWKLTVGNVPKLAAEIINSNQEYHCKIFGTPPIWILDDITPEMREKMIADLGRPLFSIETSPGNYTVCIGAENKIKAATINLNKWNCIRDYLIEKYNADINGSSKNHYWRLPGCPRINLDYIPRAVLGDLTSDTLLDKIYESRKSEYEEIQSAVEKHKEEILKAGKSVDEVPDWFLEKFQRIYDSQTAAKYPSQKLFRTIKDIIRSGRGNKNELKYAGRALKILSSGAYMRKNDRKVNPEEMVAEALAEVVAEVER